MPVLSKELRYFAAAVQFLTRLPIPLSSDYQALWLERGVKYFPAIGALIGAICASVLLITSHLWGGSLPSVLAVAVGIVLTGGLHEDGFADFFDALGGSTREDRLAIMKDSRLGTYGALALGFGVAIKVLALAALPLSLAAAPLIAAFAGGRFAAVAVIVLLPYAGEVSAAKVKPLRDGVTAPARAIAAAFGLLPLLLLPLPCSLAACAGGFAAALFIAWLAKRLLGGYTGDVLGAVEQSYEIAFLLVAAACA
jgi:adenosylcobinamide-GDP ribazoletransferase